MTDILSDLARCLRTQFPTVTNTMMIILNTGTGGMNLHPPFKVLATNQETNLRLQSFNLLASQIHSSPGNQARHAAI